MILIQMVTYADLENTILESKYATFGINSSSDRFMPPESQIRLSGSLKDLQLLMSFPKHHKIGAFIRMNPVKFLSSKQFSFSGAYRYATSHGLESSRTKNLPRNSFHMNFNVIS